MRILLVVALLFPSLAFAQQQPQIPPNEQALADKLGRELVESVSCSGNLIAAQRELQALRARVKELEARDKPKE